MALTDPPDTLAFHQSRVLCAHRDMSGVKTSDVTARVKLFFEDDKYKTTSPESEALWFYGMNHGMALIQAEYAPLQPLGGGVLEYVEKYHANMGPKALRAFYYLLMICTREFRHCKNFKAILPKIGKKFGQGVADFLEASGYGEQGIHNSLIATPPMATIGNFTKALQWGFYNGSWGGGYGGPAWGKVTDCLVRFVTGEFTAEMMLDTVWTLCHNNGPIFNKGMMYGCYGPYIIKLLDVQRSGQIPEAILSGEEDIGGHADAELINLMGWLNNAFPGKIGAYVDWYQVEALGSVHQYPHEKKKQAKKYGVSPKMAEHEKQALLLQKQAEIDKAMKVAEHAANTFEIMPGVSVQKFKPERPAKAA